MAPRMMLTATAALLLAVPLAARAAPSATQLPAAPASAVTQIDYRCGPYGYWVHSHYTPYGYVYGHCARYHRYWHRRYWYPY